MSAVDLAASQLQTDEGFRSDCYDDGNGAPIITHGQPTIGYGCRCRQWSRDLALVVLRYQVQQIDAALRLYGWYRQIEDSTRQAAVLNVAFNLGVTGMVSGYPRMIAAMESGDWATASQECHVKQSSLDQGRYDRIRKALLIGGAE